MRVEGREGSKHKVWGCSDQSGAPMMNSIKNQFERKYGISLSTCERRKQKRLNVKCEK